MPRRHVVVQLLTSTTTLPIKLMDTFFSHTQSRVVTKKHTMMQKTNDEERLFALLVLCGSNHRCHSCCKATTLGWLLPWVCLLSLQYSSSRPSSTETARLGSRTNSVSSHTKPERDLRPLSLRYSSPQRSSYLQSAESSALSQIYSTPYSALHHASPQRLEKAPLVKVISQSGV